MTFIHHCHFFVGSGRNMYPNAEQRKGEGRGGKGRGGVGRYYPKCNILTMRNSDLMRMMTVNLSLSGMFVHVSVWAQPCSRVSFLKLDEEN